MNTEDLIKEAILLPVEERAIIVDSLLKSLNQPVSELDKKWIDTARNRLDELRSKKVIPKDGEKVFNDIWVKYKR